MLRFSYQLEKGKDMEKESAGCYSLPTGHGRERYYAVKVEAGWRVWLGSNEVEDFDYYREAKEFILSELGR